MDFRLFKCHIRVALSILIISFAIGCGGSGNSGPMLEDIPVYPNSTEGETMEKALPGGILGGKLAQYTTDDPFDDVVDFYTTALAPYNPELMSHTSDLGRQTVISIKKNKGMLSVTIQEFEEEGTVNITFMSVGK